MEVVTLILIATACAGSRAAVCEPVPAEVVRFAARPVYRACEVTSAAEAPSSLRSVPYVAAYTTGQCARASIEFVVDSSGWPLMPTARIVRTNDSTYAKHVIVAIGAAQFKPARRDGRAVAQLAIIERSSGEVGAVAKVPFAVGRSDRMLPPPTEPKAGC